MTGKLSKQVVLIGMCKNGSAQISGCVANGNDAIDSSLSVIIIFIQIEAALRTVAVLEYTTSQKELNTQHK